MPLYNNTKIITEFICVAVQKSCGSTTNMNNTYFVSPKYPITYRGGERCTITVQRCNSNICQVTHNVVSIAVSHSLYISHICSYDWTFWRPPGPNPIQLDFATWMYFWYREVRLRCPEYAERTPTSMVKQFMKIFMHVEESVINLTHFSICRFQWSNANYDIHRYQRGLCVRSTLEYKDSTNSV